jgi:aspartyl-tRNA synthetase
MSATTYRSHTCGELRDTHAGQTVRLAGWVHRKRDHGQLLFVDLRDHYGITQCVVDVTSPVFKSVEGLRLETVAAIGGLVKPRSADTVNAELATVRSRSPSATSRCSARPEALPFPVNADTDTPRRCASRYRFLDLRHERIHRNIVLRSQVIASIRRPHDRAGLHRAADADPHVQLAGRRARLPRAVALHPARSTRCRRRRSSSSSC